MKPPTTFEATTSIGPSLYDGDYNDHNMDEELELYSPSPEITMSQQQFVASHPHIYPEFLKRVYNLTQLMSNKSLLSNPNFIRLFYEIHANSTLSNTEHKQNTDGNLFQFSVGLIIMLSVFYGIISLVAVVGNCLVMWVVASSRMRQSVTNYFIANLALADVIIGLFSIPFQVRALM